MDFFKFIEDIFIKIRRNPFKTIALLLITVIFFGLSKWGDGFLNEAGRMKAKKMIENKPTTSDSIINKDTFSGPIPQHIFEDLCAANSYASMSNITGTEKALILYRQAIQALPESVLSNLDQNMLRQADRAYDNKHNDFAKRNYQTLFDEFYSRCSELEIKKK